MVYYKMKAILLLTLSAIILSQSYGFVYADHGGHHYTAEEAGTITIVTNSSSYEEGDMINISGSVSDYRESDVNMQHVITLTFLNPKNSYIGVEQSLLNPDGSYSITVNAVGSQWKFEGDYTITACNGKDRCASTTFIFVLDVIPKSQQNLQRNGQDKLIHASSLFCDVIDNSLNRMPEFLKYISSGAYLYAGKGNQSISGINSLGSENFIIPSLR